MLPLRAPGMDDEVLSGGRNHYWYDRPTDEEILAPLPDPPTFPEDIDVVRNRVRAAIGKVTVARVMTARHPAIARLLAQDEARRQKQATATYTFSWENPVFDSPIEQRRLRILNALFLAVAKCGGRPEVNGREARNISIKVHQTRVAASLDRPPMGRSSSRGAKQEDAGIDRLRFAMRAPYDYDREQMSWQDGEGARLESLIQDIAVEVVTAAEVNYRERCVRDFEWRVQRKAQLEEEIREQQLQAEREQREHQLRLEQARVDRLLEEAASLRRATDIRAYVDAVRRTAMGDTVSVSWDKVEQWSQWALAEADRIDPVKTGRFLQGHDEDDSAN